MQASRTIFDRYHPAVALAYCGVLLVFSMVVIQLVYLLLTFCGLFALEASLCGAKASLRNLAWQAPLVMVLAIANPLFVSAGSTELFRIGMHAFYLESLVYGACQGLMLANVLLAFSVASHIVTSDKVLCTLGNLTPTLALMMSMTMRLVPQFARRGKDILATQKACTSIENAALDTAAARSACTAAAPHMPSINAAQAEALQPASLSQAAFSRSISFAQAEAHCNASRAQTGNSNAESCPQERFAESCDRPEKSQMMSRTASAASPSKTRKNPFCYPPLASVPPPNCAQLPSPLDGAHGVGDGRLARNGRCHACPRVGRCEEAHIVPALSVSPPRRTRVHRAGGIRPVRSRVRVRRLPAVHVLSAHRRRGAVV